jgi:hypothetical protein
MTPKEKAQELIDKHNVFAIEKEAIQHAIISLEEILAVINESMLYKQSKRDFWAEVKQELEKL